MSKYQILNILNYFLEKFNAKFDRNIKNISSSAFNILLNYQFPGNIRELENLIERSVALSNTNILLPDSLAMSIHKRRWIEGVRNRRFDVDEVPNGVALDAILAEIDLEAAGLPVEEARLSSPQARFDYVVRSTANAGMRMMPPLLTALFRASLRASRGSEPS